MNTQKGFAPILLILVGLVVVGGGVYFYTQNNSKNVQGLSNEILLDTYVDEKYNFELKYPKEWSVGRSLGDPSNPIKEGELLVELNFSNYSAEEAEKQYQTNSKYADDTKNINVKVYSAEKDFRYEFSIYPKDNEDLNKIIETIKK